MTTRVVQVITWTTLVVIYCATGIAVLERLGIPLTSLVAPAAASLTFIGNAFAAKIFLHERVDQRRWIAAVLVAGGVALLAG